MLGLHDADSAENKTPSANLVVIPVQCEIPRGAPGQLNPPRTEAIRILPGTRAAALYGKLQVEEALVCSFEFNGEYRKRFEEGGWVASGVGPRGEVRIAEWPGPGFNLGMMTVPSYLSRKDSPHPVITAFLQAALERRRGY